VFRRPVYQAQWEAVREACKEAAIPVAVTALSDTARDIRQAGVGSMAVVIGSEGQGVRKEILEAAEEKLIIPMDPRCESLNAAIAAAIVMWQMKL
jgi:TrmH family RNA methyltransferase